MRPAPRVAIFMPPTMRGRGEPTGALRGLGLEQLVGVQLRPLRERADRLEQRAPERSEAVLDTGRRTANALACDEPVRLELAQRLRQHLLADAADPLLQIGVTPRALPERVDDHDRPGVRHEAEGGARRAIREEHVVAHAPMVGRTAESSALGTMRGVAPDQTYRERRPASALGGHAAC